MHVYTLYIPYTYAYKGVYKNANLFLKYVLNNSQKD